MCSAEKQVDVNECCRSQQEMSARSDVLGGFDELKPERITLRRVTRREHECFTGEACRLLIFDI